MINSQRLMADLADLSRIGRTKEGGITRRSFDVADLSARAWLSDKIKSAGLELKIDAAGNISGRIGGEGPAVVSGSHLDTIVNGGALDGALGVLCALECLRVIRERDLPVRLPVEMVAFTDEEERFMFGVGSSAWSGVLDRSAALQLCDAQQISLREAMAAAGLDIENIDSARRDPADIKAFLELHIEQGPLLEQEGLSIGVVENVLGNYRFRVCIDGQQDHAGNPMPYRRDPLLAAVRVIDAARHHAQRIASPEEMLFTAGVFQVAPGISNVIPGQVCFTLDYRHARGDLLRKSEEYLQACLREVCAQSGVTGRIDCMERVEPLDFSPMVCDAVSGAADQLGIAWRRIASGAGHDAQIIGRSMPAAMIFVPSQGGRSHCPDEQTDQKDILNGAHVLLQSLLALAQCDRQD